jgi:CDP-glycerol glycerophosphotransferase (TagB/SpsB family)
MQALRGWIPHQFQTLWLPHGQSDKGWKEPFFEALQQEDGLFVYGQRMQDVLQAKNISIPQLRVGNFRKQYFEKHRPFYEQLIAKKFGDQPFVLYAPTWEDTEKNGLFWEAIDRLFHKIGDRLLVKPHPNTERRYLVQLACKKGRFVEQFPPIYPLLEQTEAYIGDMSSIGYDFLCYERPLFFVCRQKTDPFSDPSAFLMRCGEQVLLSEIDSFSFQTSQNKLAKQTLSAQVFDASVLSRAFNNKLESFLTHGGKNENRANV